MIYTIQLGRAFHLNSHTPKKCMTSCQIITPFISSNISANHNKRECFQPIVKFFYPLWFLFFKSLFLKVLLLAQSHKQERPLFERKKSFLKETSSFLKWYTFYPEKKMLFVSYVKQQIYKYLNIFGSYTWSFLLMRNELFNFKWRLPE